MKITLTSSAVAALKILQEQIKQSNEFAQKRYSPIVSQIIIEASQLFSGVQIEQLSLRLVPPTGQKKARLKRLEKIADAMDDEAILKLERSIKRNKNLQPSEQESNEK